MPWPRLNMTLAWWHVLIQTQQQRHQRGLHIQYTPLPEYFDSLSLFIFVAFCFSFETKSRTLESFGIEDGSTAGSRDQYIFTLFRVPHELVNGVKK